MKKIISLIILFILVFGSNTLFAQKMNWIIGGRAGLSIGSGGGTSSAGFQLGPNAEILFGGGDLAIGTEFNINTQSGTPIEWADYIRYYFKISGSKLKPYVGGGFSMWFMTGGPYFGLRFGGGVNFPIGNKLYVPVDLVLGPIFVTGTSVFYVAITSGIRYEL